MSGRPNSGAIANHRRKLKAKSPRLNTAIAVSESGISLNKKQGARPWSEGPAKQFGLRPIVASQDYPEFNKGERQHQVEALLDFYENHHGSKWAYSDGYSAALHQRRIVGAADIDPSTLQGVRLDHSGTCVEALELPRCDVAGNPLAAFFASLHHLKVLRLNSNRLRGKLASSLGSTCKLLTDIDLSNNHFTGHVPPTLSTLPVLKLLRIQDNRLTGPLPDLRGSRQSLEVLNLCNNQLSGGVAALAVVHPTASPPDGGTSGWGARKDGAIGPFPKLRELHLGQNKLGGDIAPLLAAKLPCLVHLSAPNNLLGGPLSKDGGRGDKHELPQPLRHSLPSLRFLFLDHNRISGPLGDTLFCLTGLRSLSLSGNLLTGPVLESVGNLTNLVDLWVSNNKLTGQLPVDVPGKEDTDESDNDGDGGESFEGGARRSSGGRGARKSEGGSNRSKSDAVGGKGLGALRPTLRVLGLCGNAFKPLPNDDVEALACLEHHDLPKLPTSEDIQAMLIELGGAKAATLISSTQPLRHRGEVVSAASGSGEVGTSRGGTAASSPTIAKSSPRQSPMKAAGVKDITVLRRDKESVATGNAPHMGEYAIKVAQGEKNWRDVQLRQAKLEEETRREKSAAAAELGARQHAMTRRKELNDARLSKLEREAALKELRKKVVREANTSGPRIAQQITDAQDARKHHALEKIRRRKLEFGA